MRRIAIGLSVLSASCQLFGGITERDLASTGGTGGGAGSSAGSGGASGSSAGSGGASGSSAGAGGLGVEHAALYGDLENQITRGLALDRASGRASLVGDFRGELDFGGSAAPLVADADGDLFVARFEATGATLWAKHLILTPRTWWSPPFVATSTDGSSFVGLNGNGTIWFDASHGGPVDDHDICLGAYASDGTVVWNRRYGGALDQTVSALLADGDELVVAGRYAGDLDFGGNTTSLWTPEHLTYLARLDQAGNGLSMRVFEDCEAMAITAMRRSESDSTLIVGGSFSKACTLGDGVVLSSDVLDSHQDCFVAKLTLDGTPLWATALRTLDCSFPNVAVDDDGAVLLTGSVFGGSQVFPELASNDHDVFVVKLQSSGSPLWARSLQRAGTDRPLSVDADADATIAVAGMIESGTLVALLSPSGALSSALELGAPTPLGEPGSFAAFDSDGGLTVAGTLAKSANFAGQMLEPAGAGTTDVFLAKLSR
jgi:hypothetical protein